MPSIQKQIEALKQSIQAQHQRYKQFLKTFKLPDGDKRFEQSFEQLSPAATKLLKAIDKQIQENKEGKQQQQLQQQYFTTLKLSIEHQILVILHNQVILQAVMKETKLPEAAKTVVIKQGEQFYGMQSNLYGELLDFMKSEVLSHTDAIGQWMQQVLAQATNKFILQKVSIVTHDAKSQCRTTHQYEDEFYLLLRSYTHWCIEQYGKGKQFDISIKAFGEIKVFAESFKQLSGRLQSGGQIWTSDIKAILPTGY